MRTGTCNVCGQDDRFPSGGCRPCARRTTEARKADIAAYQRAYRAKSLGSVQERQAAWSRKWRYGFSQENYDAMLVAQGNICALCGNPETRVSKYGRVQSLVVDHDHATGAIRALLCHSCNVALGHFRDDPALLEKAADYLRSHVLEACDEGPESGAGSPVCQKGVI